MLYLFVSPLSAMMAPRAPGASRASVIMAVPAPAAPVGLPKVGVMAVQGGFAAQLEALERQSSVEGVEVRSVEDLEGLDALILPGGESTAQGHILSRSGMLEATREFAATKPVWGVCAGMILMADELSGSAAQPLIGGLKVSVERNAFGRQIDSRYRSIELRSGLGLGLGLALSPTPTPTPTLTPTLALTLTLTTAGGARAAQRTCLLAVGG